jgi:ubiquinone/menaquinone biosynthesis C-methylase UbiE
MTESPSRFHDRSLRRHLRYLNWLYNPFQRLEVTGVYDLLGTETATDRALYLNLGYWPDATDIDAASEALAMLVGERAQIAHGDQVLDVGFGFGDQDLLWSRRLPPHRLVGLNITESQVEVARQRIAAEGLDDRIDLRPGSATEMPLPDECVDKVVALECAFHFQTRADFFREAWRVLRPGGRLVTADIIPMPRTGGWAQRLGQRLSWWLVATRFAVPAENAYTVPSYHAYLRLAGFDGISIESIRDRVYLPLHAYLRDDPGVIDRVHPAVRPMARLSRRLSADVLYSGLDYILTSAVKPGRPPRPDR